MKTILYHAISSFFRHKIYKLPTLEDVCSPIEGQAFFAAEFISRSKKHSLLLLCSNKVGDKNLAETKLKLSF